jgi:hypothetical protein
MKLSRKLGVMLLGFWLIATGLISIIHLSFTGLDLIMAVVAILTGILLVIGR